MAQLKDIVGALLRDIVEGQAIADRRSRELCELYYKDPLLRHFPVPRVKISSIELDLKFAISDAEESAQTQTELIAGQDVENKTTTGLNSSVEIAITASDLARMPVEKLSCLRIRTTIQNHKWTTIRKKSTKDTEESNLVDD